MDKILQKKYPTYQIFLIAQNLWQPHYKILSTIFLNEFIVLNVNPEMMLKNVKDVELNIRIATLFLNTPISKVI